MQLNYKSFGQGEPVIILHGLFGTLDNWQTIARQLAESHTVFIVDQRNHGRSPHSEVHDYPSMAEDLRAFMEEHWIYSAHLIGHSMGGKTAMQFALEHDDMVNKLVVVDIAPKPYPDRHQHIFEALLSLDLRKIRDRREAEALLAPVVPDAGERLFLMKNLSRRAAEGEGVGDDGFEFKMNLPVIYKHYPDIIAGIDSDQVFEKPALFIRGGLSNYIEPQDEVLIKHYFPLAEVKTVENAGHWVHADQPAELLKLVRAFLGLPPESM